MMDEKTKGILLRCARTYFTLKNWPKALAEYKSLELEFPHDPFLLEPMALIYQSMGDKALALAYARRAMDAFKAKGQDDKAEKLSQHFNNHPDA